jgi:hypothetical protein
MLVKRMGWIVLLVLGLAASASAVMAQQSPGNAVARLTVLTAGVEMRRVNTEAWVPLKAESLVGVGDSVRTLEGGTASLSIFDGVAFYRMANNAEIAIESFTGVDTAFSLSLAVRAGNGTAIARRVLGGETNFRLMLPTFSASILEGETEIRVEADQRSALLIPEKGRAVVTEQGDTEAEVGDATGVRAALSEKLSDVVRATTFTLLDLALDGCPSQVNFPGDFLLVVRLGAGPEFAEVGSLRSGTNVQLMGINASGGWYRLRYNGGFGWVNISRPPLDRSCLALRIFANAYGPEDISLFKALPEEPPQPSTPAVTATPAN